MNDEATYRVRVLSGQCATCIFRPGNLMHLRPGRLRDMVERCRVQDRHIPCHEFLTRRRGRWVYGPHAGGAVCHGYWTSVERPWYLQVAERLGLIEWVAPPESGGPAPPRADPPEGKVDEE